jgi:AAA15 family ATPase/GTPase
MHLNRFTIENYRKFGKENNSVSFSTNIEGSNLLGSTLVIGQNNAGKTSIVTALKKASGAETFSPTDFHFNYLYDIISFFYTNKADIKKALFA